MTKKYIGTKIITAFPQEKEGKPGYGVIYADGYTSWSPKEVFEESYRAIEREGQSLTFGDALHMLKLGKKVARAGWNGKGMFVYQVPAASYPAQRNSAGTMLGVFKDDLVPYREYLALKTAQDDVATWSPSCSDALAEDWQVVE